MFIHEMWPVTESADTYSPTIARLASAITFMARDCDTASPYAAESAAAWAFTFSWSRLPVEMVKNVMMATSKSAMAKSATVCPDC